MYTLHTCFCEFRVDSRAQSVLSNKISASELSQKFIRSALLAGQGSNKNNHTKHGFLKRKKKALELARPNNLSPVR